MVQFPQVPQVLQSPEVPELPYIVTLLHGPPAPEALLPACAQPKAHPHGHPLQYRQEEYCDDAERFVPPSPSRGLAELRDAPSMNDAAGTEVTNGGMWRGGL